MLDVCVSVATDAAEVVEEFCEQADTGRFAGGQNPCEDHTSSATGLRRAERGEVLLNPDAEAISPLIHPEVTASVSSTKFT